MEGQWNVSIANAVVISLSRAETHTPSPKPARWDSPLQAQQMREVSGGVANFGSQLVHVTTALSGPFILFQAKWEERRGEVKEWHRPKFGMVKGLEEETRQVGREADGRLTELQRAWLQSPAALNASRTPIPDPQSKMAAAAPQNQST